MYKTFLKGLATGYAISAVAAIVICGKAGTTKSAVQQYYADPKLRTNA